jgi:hypothetical protein
LRPTPEELASLQDSQQEKTSQELRESDQNARETSQDLRESDQDARESRQDAQKFDQASRETGQDLRESNQDARESRQDARKLDQASRETGQNTRQSNQDLRESGQNLREAGQEFLESGQALADIKVRYQLLVDSVTDYAIYMLDPEGRVVTWNVGAERLKGYTAEEALGRDYSVLFPPEDAQMGLPAQELAAAAREGRYETQAWRQRKDGSRFWALVTLTAIRDPERELCGFANVTRDMTAHEAADEAARSHNAQLERYRIIIESIADYVIFTLDSEGRIDGWSSGARSVLGYTDEEAKGREYSMVFTPVEIQAGAPRQEMEEAARQGHCAADNWRVRRDGSLFWASGVLTAIHDETGKLTGYVRVARDMTPQKRLEESLAMMAADLEGRVAERTSELEASVAELQRKNREVEAFVYIVSHDLRAPLVNVQGFVRELEESCKHLRTVIQSSQNWEPCWSGVQPILDEEMGGALHFISASTAKFERLINALLGFSRQGQQVYRMVQVDVRELVASAAANFQQAITEAGAEVEVGDLPSVTGDVTALGQVFSNLIGNALKYRSPERPLKIEVGGQAKGAMVRYWVRDNGLGIPEFAKARLFRVFQRFHPQQAEGEGMGLAIAYRIVERHGGKTWAESQEGAGSTFNFSLPRTQQTAPIEA